MDMTEAAATNVLLGAVLGTPPVDGVSIGEEAARRAAIFLATRAHEALRGGLEGEAVASRWARRFRSRIAVCEWCREVRETVASCLGCGEELCLRCWGDGNDRLCAVCQDRRSSTYEDVVVTSGLL